MRTGRDAGVLLALVIAFGLLPCVLSAAEDETAATASRETVSQYGITWTFAEPAAVGQFVTGDHFVVGPVTVASVSPAPSTGRSGSVVDPPAGKRQGYDDRISGFDASLRASFPLELKPGESLVSTHSLNEIGDRTPDTVPGQYARGPLRTAVVLTCVDEAPPADAFRPPFCGTEKPLHRASDLRRDLLPNLEPVDEIPDVARYERFLERIWLDHLYEWSGRMLHPLENMPDYGRELTNIVSNVGLMLVLEDSDGERETLLLRFVQLGIDLYGITQSDNDLWRANGGHHSGRKLPIIFAGVLLDDEGMKNVQASFAEDQQTYYGEGWHGQKVLWTISTAESRKHEHLPPEKWAGPPFKGANDGWKSEGYRALNGPTWIGEALVARLMGAKGYWDHDAFFDYVDRWVAEAPDGRVDRELGIRESYRPFNSDFVRSMWQTYRSRADEIGAEVLARAKGTDAGR